MCPRCTTRLEVPEDAKQSICPTCGHRARPPPAGWAPAPNLDDLTPGRQKALLGRERSTAHVLLLTLVTFGVYALVYAYRAFKEADDQHGRLHATWVYLFAVLFLAVGVGTAAGLAFVALPLAAVAALAFVPLHVYWCLELRRVQDYRAARGMRRRIGPTGYTLWVVLLPVVGFLVALVRVNDSLRELWRHVQRETGLKPKLG